MMPIVKGFRRFHSSIVSSNNKQVATELSSLLSGSKRPVRKRVNNAERKQMLESFVNKYRAMNMGKFPSPTSAQKQVGGGYYSIKKMLQEMEYNFKSQHKSDSPIHLTNDNTEIINGDDAVASGIQEKSNASVDKNTNDIAKSDTLDIATENDDKSEQKTSDDNFAFKDSESEVEKQPDGIKSIAGDKGEEENELRGKASLWGNLKSLANGFISMWKK